MITTRFSLCALPRIIWEQRGSLHSSFPSICTFVEDALAIEQRMQKSAGQSRDRSHYNLCCMRIESAVSPELLTSVTTSEQFREALETQKLPVTTLGAGYLQILVQIIQQAPLKASAIRLGAMFFPPETVESHNVAFYRLAEQTGVSANIDVQRRIAFFYLAHQFDCGVIELQNTFQFLATVEPAQLVPLQARQLAETRAVHKEEYDQYSILRTQIEDAIQAARAGQTGGVNFSNHPHHVITEVLHEFIYEDPGRMDTPVSIQVSYDDNSRGEPFPLQCLPRRTEADVASLDPSQTLQVALLSPRHLGMSGAADLAGSQKSGISRSNELANADKLCYRLALKQLKETRSAGNLRLYLYLTTFQPALIGFFRALVQELQHRTDSPAILEVIPFYFSRKIGYWSGRSWS